MEKLNEKKYNSNKARHELIVDYMKLHIDKISENVTYLVGLYDSLSKSPLSKKDCEELTDKTIEILIRNLAKEHEGEQEVKEGIRVMFENAEKSRR